MRLEKYFDHTILKPDATSSEVIKVCDEAKKYNFASVCVNGSFTALVKEQLEGTDVKTCVVIGFPLGAMCTGVKEYEAMRVVEKGADEIDMVINIGALKEGNYDVVLEDLTTVRRACEGKVLKVIIETCLLTDDEKIKACELAMEAGADYVKTSTGFSTGGATIYDVGLMKKVVGNKCKVKAAGGIRDYNTAMALIEAGADRIGTSSTIKILNEAKNY
ncbi:MAG: deoxyribose-phosphate aldolase [Lachnospira sp.]